MRKKRGKPPNFCCHCEAGFARLAMTWNNDRRGNQPTGDCHGKRSLPRNDRVVDGLRQESRRHYGFRAKGYPFPSIHRGSVVAKIDTFLGGGNEYCTHGGARLEGSGEVALIAGAINSNPPQPASLASFLPEQERYPPEEPDLQVLRRVSFSTQKDS